MKCFEIDHCLAAIRKVTKKLFGVVGGQFTKNIKRKKPERKIMR